MKDRSVNLSAQQRSALILCDGKRSADEVVKMTAAVGVTMDDIDTLLKLGLVEIGSHPAKPGIQAPTQLAQEATQKTPQLEATTVDLNVALNSAITLCSNLGFKGFSLNMALTGVDSLEKLEKLAPEIRRVAGDEKYKPLHQLIFGTPL